MRCSCCHKPARGVWLIAEPEVRYTRNGKPAEGEHVEACGEPCAKAAVFGRHRPPRGTLVARKGRP